MEKKKEKKPSQEDPVPACLDQSNENLEDGFYCKLCGMSWYNCLCSHEDGD